MLFSQNNDGASQTKKNSLTFQDSRQEEIKRTNRSNISINSNHKTQVQGSQVDNHSFDMKPVSTINLTAEKQEKERYVKKVSHKRFTVPKTTNTNSSTITSPTITSPTFSTDTADLLPLLLPFPPLKTKYTEVLIESNLRDSGEQPVDNNYLEANKLLVEEIKKQITIPLHDRVHAYMQLLEKQNSVQIKDLELMIRTLIQEKTDKFADEQISKEEVSQMIEDECRIYIGNAYTDLIDLKTKDFATKSEVLELIEAKNELYATKTEVLELVDGKIYALNMEFLVAKYLKIMIEQGEDDEDNGKKEDDVPKTPFEEIIQPSVARIIHRVLKYDQAHHGGNEPDENNTSVHFQVDDIYDFERQEKGHFTDVEAKGNIFNPMYSSEPTIYTEEDVNDIVEMGSVYKARECSSVQHENELRKVKDRRWNRFGNGIENGSVIDLFLDKNNRKIYIVGNFKFVNRVPLENIAVYDMNEKKWKHVGEGIPQVATAIAVDEENEIVYVGGVFSKVGKGECEVRANNVAAYDVKANKWSALGDGLNRDCSAILYDNKTKKLYAGGSFTQSGSKALKYIAMYDIANQEWQPLKGGSVNGPCRIVLKPTEDDLYLGGLFTHAGNDDIHVSYVAGYNLKSDSWSSLGGGLQGYCNAITYDSNKNKLYVGGTFTSVGTVESSINANHIAEYDIATNTWNDMDGGLNNIVQSIFYDGNNACIYVGGTFTHTFEKNIQLNHIARYDLKESKWQCLENHFPNKKTYKEDDGNDNVGINGICKVMSVDNKSLFIAGSFQIAGNITANSIVRYSLNP